MFLLGSQLGDETFYALFFAFWFWNIGRNRRILEVEIEEYRDGIEEYRDGIEEYRGWNRRISGVEIEERILAVGN